MKRVREYIEKRKKYNIKKVYRFWWTKAGTEEKEYRFCYMWRIKYDVLTISFYETKKTYFSLDKFPTSKSLTDFLDNDDFWRLQKN